MIRNTYRTGARPISAANAYAKTAVAAVFALVLAAGLALQVSTAMAMKIQTVKSPGGISAWLVQEKSVPLVALRFAFEGGTAQDPSDKPGVAYFVTSMMDEGAGDLKAREFQEKMQDIAMKMSFDENRDLIYGSLQSLSDNLDESAKMLSLALTKPRFDADAVERVRAQILANLAYEAKSPQRVASKEWFKTAFPNHPYGDNASGTIESVKSISADDLHAFVKSNFARDNLKVVAVGDITPERLGVLLDEVFGGLPEKAALKPVAKAELPKGGQQRIVPMAVPQSVAVFGLPALARKDADFIPAFVLNHILGGGGFSSKLMEEVREKRGLAYSVYSYLNPLDHAPILQGGVATKNEAIAESLSVIRGELEKIAENGVSETDLKEAQDYLTGSYALRFDTNSKIAGQLLGIQVEGLGLDYVETRNSQIKAVTQADIQRAAKRFLNPDDLITVIVGQPEGIEARG